jgi:glycosyltransferase involved in cell wall biosynthesis
LTNKPNSYPKVSVIICALNEEESLPHVLPKIPDWVDEILLVDGHSVDATVEVAKKLRPDIHVVCQPGTGKGDALKFGISQATGDIIVTLDADGQTDPGDMQRFITPLLNGYDFSKGSRLADGRPLDMAFHRWVGNFIIALTCNILYRTKFTDLCSGYNAFWRKTFLNINPWTNGDWGYEPFIVARVLNHQLKVNEVPHLYVKRIEGKSKLPDSKQGLTAVKVLIVERFRHN